MRDEKQKIEINCVVEVPLSVKTQTVLDAVQKSLEALGAFSVRLDLEDHVCIFKLKEQNENES